MTASDQQTHDIGLIIIGDEILSGKREDRHFAQAKAVLAKRGLALSWVSYLGDSPDRCVAALEKSFASNDLVFSFGGIGSTPDDHTRQSAAKALRLPLVLHEQARELITLRCQESGQPLTAERLRMGEFPQGASIVPNPYNRIPGFSVGHHYFLPGFPVMAWPMMEWVLDTHYSHCFRQVAEFDRSMIVHGLFEATVTQLLEQITRDYPRLKIYSLPSAPVQTQTETVRRHLELGVKLTGLAKDEDLQGCLEQLTAAYGALREGVIGLGGEISKETALER